MANQTGRQKPPSQRQSSGGNSAKPGSLPARYEEKFEGFIGLCDRTKKEDRKDVVMIAYPWVLGDNYAEVIESLGRLADSGLCLRVAKRTSDDPSPPPATDVAVEDVSVAEKKLPPISVTWPKKGFADGEIVPAVAKAISMNPLYVGIGEMTRQFTDAQWIAYSRQVLESDGPDQFFVNLLYILRKTFGCIEWGGNDPHDSN